MFTNNFLKNKSINKEGLIYALIFIVYLIAIILIFVYSIKFLSKAINFTLSEPQNQEIEEKYSKINLENYTIIADKLNFIKATPIINQNNPSSETSSPGIIPNSENNTTLNIVNSSSNMPETVDLPSLADNTLPVAPSPVVPAESTVSPPQEIKPRLVIVNSTLTSGLASALKSKFQIANFDVLRIGNIRPSELNTVIKVKQSVNQNSAYFFEIKKIVSEKYDFVLKTLEEEADYEIEIIIGEK